jgi:hypothetical protein
MQPEYIPSPAEFWSFVSVVASFWSKVDTSGDCWLWKPKARSHGGYGIVGIAGRTHLAHRVSYAITYGVHPGTLLVCHRCDVRLCVRPDHLFLGTYAENNHDMRYKGRAADGRKRYARVPVERRPIGERHGRAKLTDNDVRSIRSQYARGGITHRELSAEFGVGVTTIGGIIRGKEWRHT